MATGLAGRRGCLQSSSRRTSTCLGLYSSSQRKSPRVASVYGRGPMELVVCGGLQSPSDGVRRSRRSLQSSFDGASRTPRVFVIVIRRNSSYAADVCHRHPRERGDPATFRSADATSVRGALPPYRLDFPAARSAFARHPREGGDPGLHPGLSSKSLQAPVSWRARRLAVKANPPWPPFFKGGNSLGRFD
jgi:hypothetical protein